LENSVKELAARQRKKRAGIQDMGKINDPRSVANPIFHRRTENFAAMKHGNLRPRALGFLASGTWPGRNIEVSSPGDESPCCTGPDFWGTRILLK